jgi:benzodiazapine receptor
VGCRGRDRGDLGGYLGQRTRALAEVGLLWLSIVLLIVHTARASDVVAWLLVPYLLWVAFAAALNCAVMRLNPPF